MPADSATPLLQCLVMGTGNDNNSWGDNFNNSILTLLENAIAGQTSLAITGGSYSLTDNDARSKVLFLTGTLTSDQTIVCANRFKNWKIYNGTTGSFAVLFKTASGTAVNIPRGKSIDVFCDGSNGVYRSDAHMVGGLFFHAGTTAPPGAFECDGSTIKRASFVDLFAVIGTTWGVGDGSTTYAVPPGKDTGRFVRARTGSLNVGTSQSNTVGPHNHTASFSSGVTDSQGSHVHTGITGSQNANHQHAFGLTVSTSGAATGSNIFPATGVLAGGSTTVSSTQSENANHQHDFSGMVAAGAHTHNVSGVVTVNNNTGTTETRPEAIVGMLCIWY